MTPHDCAMNFPLHRVDVSNFTDGGETVDLEHTPRGMPITFVGDEPAEPVYLLRGWKVWLPAIAVVVGALLATVLLSAYRG